MWAHFWLWASVPSSTKFAAASTLSFSSLDPDKDIVRLWVTNQSAKLIIINTPGRRQRMKSDKHVVKEVIQSQINEPEIYGFWPRCSLVSFKWSSDQTITKSFVATSLNFLQSASDTVDTLGSINQLPANRIEDESGTTKPDLYGLCVRPNRCQIQFRIEYLRKQRSVSHEDSNRSTLEMGIVRNGKDPNGVTSPDKE